MKRLAVAEIYQLTNSFNPRLTSREDYERLQWQVGPGWLETSAQGVAGGWLSLPEVLGEAVEWVELLQAVAWPGGAVTADLQAEMLATLQEGLAGETVDGMLLALHGGQASETEPDLAGLMVASVREIVGPRVPVVVTLAVEANVTERLARSADVLLAPHTYPVADLPATGRRAARALADLLQTGSQVTRGAWKQPLFGPPEKLASADGLLAHVWQHFPTAENLPGMLSVALLHPSPWLDVPALGWTFVQACLCDQPVLDDRAVARACWQVGEELTLPACELGELAGLAAASEGPLWVCEVADALEYGAPGDNTALLAELLAAPVKGGAVVLMVDETATRELQGAGTGSQPTLTVGGRHDTSHPPVTLTGRRDIVARVPLCLPAPHGATVTRDVLAGVITCGETRVVLADQALPGMELPLLAALGVPLETAGLVAIKTARPGRGWEQAVRLAGAGCTSPDLTALPYQQVDHPVVPLDALTDPPLAAWAGDLLHRCACAGGGCSQAAEGGASGCGKCCGREE
jgi:microcystin degradation protein MlrC